MASRNPELRGCLRRKLPNHNGVGHLGGQRCEDVSGESGLNAMGQGISEVSVVKMSQAKVAKPLWGRASPRSALRGCLRRKWPENTRAPERGLCDGPDRTTPRGLDGGGLPISRKAAPPKGRWHGRALMAVNSESSAIDAVGACRMPRNSWVIEGALKAL